MSICLQALVHYFPSSNSAILIPILSYFCF
jgi:hypothetical protein